MLPRFRRWSSNVIPASENALIPRWGGFWSRCSRGASSGTTPAIGSVCLHLRVNNVGEDFLKPSLTIAAAVSSQEVSIRGRASRILLSVGPTGRPRHSEPFQTLQVRRQRQRPGPLMIAVTNSFGVTSKAGLKTETTVRHDPHAADVCHPFASRCSIGMCEPSGIFRSSGRKGRSDVKTECRAVCQNRQGICPYLVRHVTRWPRSCRRRR